ncbi:hypothetical protein AOB60_23955 [Streptomyces noursei]|uniref:Uncharacterized protein n=1 Tax=Streptomyces noursei TaxID=1971 RepID=A0A2N8P8N0_STRNR|nr:hypothetical protein AOB60_23955 [Streptomyces noursei]
MVTVRRDPYAHHQSRLGLLVQAARRSEGNVAVPVHDGAWDEEQQGGDLLPDGVVRCAVRCRQVLDETVSEDGAGDEAEDEPQVELPVPAVVVRLGHPVREFVAVPAGRGERERSLLATGPKTQTRSGERPCGGDQGQEVSACGQATVGVEHVGRRQ